MGKHSFYDKDTGEKVFGSGTRQSVRDSYGGPNWVEIQKENEFWQKLNKVVSLVGIEGIASDRYGTYLSGCGLYDTKGYCLIAEEKIRGNKYKSSPISPVFKTLDELLTFLMVNTPLVDAENTLTEFGDRIWNFLSQMNEKDDTILHFMCKILPTFSIEWWDWTHE